MAVKKTKKTNYSIVEQTPEIKAWWKVTRKYNVLTPTREKYLFDEIASAEKLHDYARKEKAIEESLLRSPRTHTRFLTISAKANTEFCSQ